MLTSFFLSCTSLGIQLTNSLGFGTGQTGSCCVVTGVSRMLRFGCGWRMSWRCCPNSTDCNPHNFYRCERFILIVSGNLRNRINHILLRNDLAENRMFAVQPRRRRHRDKELRAVRVWPGVGHRQNTWMVEGVSRANLIFELVPGAPHSLAGRIAYLNQKLRTP